MGGDNVACVASRWEIVDNADSWRSSRMKPRQTSISEFILVIDRNELHQHLRNQNDQVFDIAILVRCW